MKSLSPKSVFFAIGSHFSTHEHIGRICGAAGSTEEWFNWECYIALHHELSDVRVRPRYPTGRSFGDLSISAGNQRLMIETKIISDNTLDKYYPIIERDRAKLAALVSEHQAWQGLHLIFMYSPLGLRRASWQVWPESYDAWFKIPAFTCQVRFDKKGELRLRGWAFPSRSK
jgi:hypothetical protein